MGKRYKILIFILLLFPILSTVLRWLSQSLNRRFSMRKVSEQNRGSRLVQKLKVFVLIGTTFYFLLSGSAQASFFERIVDLFATVSKGPIQVSYRFFVPNDTLDPWDPWPPGATLDLTENGYLNSMSFPPLPGQMFRLRVGIKAADADLPASDRKFKLQFGKLTSGQTNCSSITVWNDLGSPGAVGDWRGFDMTQLTSDAQITVNKLSGASVKGSYQESNPTPFNPSVLKDQIIEYDWSVQNNITNSALDGGFYCFRMVNQDGTSLKQYLQYPKVATMPPFVNSVSSTINISSGGTINMSNTNGTGLTFVVPANYSLYSQSFDIHNLNVNDFLDQVSGGPSGKSGAHSYIYQMNAERNNVATSSFNQNLTMKIDYSDSEVSSVNESTLRIYKYDGISWNAQSTTLDTTINRATTEVNSFSSFGLFGDPTPTPTPTPASGSGGGGGGGGGFISYPTATVTFSGRAYPKSTITLLRDAQVVATTIAGADANFSINLSNLSGGNYIFSVYSEDRDGRRSNLSIFPLSITSGAATNVSGIFIAPTIATDKAEVKRGDDIAIFGQSVPQSDIIISVNSEEDFFGKTISDKDGIYLYNFDTSPLAYGTHNAKSKSSIGNQSISGWSYLVGFKVGTKTVLAKPPTKAVAKGDLNNDSRVNIVDFSIMVFWYKRAGFPIGLDLNNDGRIDLKDFSIMAYFWTG